MFLMSEVPLYRVLDSTVEIQGVQPRHHRNVTPAVFRGTKISRASSKYAGDGIQCGKDVTGE